MSNEFEVMKGFNLTLKGDGHSPETLPSEPSGDVYLGETLEDKFKAKKKDNIGSGDNKPGGTGVIMSEELDDLPGEAERDITEGYVADIQNAKVSTGKGYEAFNEMVKKGVLVDDLKIDRNDVAGSLRTIEKTMDEKLAEKKTS